MQRPLLPFTDPGQTSTTAATARSPEQPSYWPKRTTHVSRRTASAILFTLEEAIRTPFPFTPDKIEENASMADLRGGVGTPRTQNGARTAANAAPPVTPAAANPEVRMRSPRQVMRDREMRMKKKQQEEQEEQERVSAVRREAQAAGAGDPAARNRYSGGAGQSLQSPQAQRRSEGAGSGAPRVSQTSGTQARAEPAATRTSGQTQRPQGVQARSRAPSQPDQPQPTTTQAPRGGSNSYTQQQQQTSQTRLGDSNQAGTTRAQAQPSESTQRRPGDTQPGSTPARASNSASFPHAFERWEMLSSHWEGLTKFWIKRLQGNSDELKGQPLNQQLARQVTDLSAAGANLFHAVVELQRLRASSERKFQRWFFETREEHEKNQERIAQLEAELNEARRNRTTDQPSSKAREETLEQARQEARRMAEERIAKIQRETEMAIKEKNRELEISKEEARRGWEEIGRMEQENRDRTFSLRRGEPTIVGGVQVVPMMATGTSRQTSTSRGHAGGGLSSHPPHAEGGAGLEPGYTAYDPARSETDTDPITEGGRDAPVAPMDPTSVPSQPPTSNAAMQAARASASPRPRTAGDIAPSTNAAYEPDQPVQAPTTSSFYQQHGAATALHSGELGYPPTSATGAGGDARYAYSEEGSLGEEEEYLADEHGHLLYDVDGNPIPARHHGILGGGEGAASEEGESADYDIIDQLQRDRLLQPYPVPGGRYGPSSNDGGGSSYSTPPDYAGTGYGGGAAGQWDIPRHHHPTRLSDVPEEDERSRTSPSRASQRSRGLH